MIKILRAFSKNHLPCFPVNSSSDLLKIRNLGIVAHIDAGKTTLTERMLFYCGALKAPGNVDEGTTVMDYLPQERTRGITIRAAAITFAWRGFQFNLIDTPGHIDFSGEVERSLRVMDGSVLVVDANNGIQTQTQTVWKQAEKFHVPRVIFLNKMDLHSASAELSLSQIKSIFKATPLLLQLPLFAAGGIVGIIDLVNMTVVRYKDALGSVAEVESIEKLDAEMLKKVKKANIELLEEISSLDDEFAEKYLNGNVSETEILLAIRKLTVRMLAFPVLCGSALKNRGVQPVLDAVVNFLPSPAESLPAEGHFNHQLLTRAHTDKKLCALAYKVIQNSSKGPLVYARIYSGKLKHAESLKNTTRKTTEKLTKILRVRSNEYLEITEASAGDVVAISGLKEVYSGDTLIAKNDSEEIRLEGVKMPPPVFFCSISAEEEAKEKDLEEVLKWVAKEDPSYSANLDEESGQVFVTGQGELHLEILRDRLLSDYNLKTRLGELKVAYRETIQKNTEHTIELDRPGHYFCIKFRISRVVNEITVDKLEAVIHGQQFEKLLATSHWDCSQLQVYYDKINAIRNDPKRGQDEEEYSHISRINEGFKQKIMENLQNALKRGPVVGFPLINVRVDVIDGIFSRSRTDLVAINEGVAVGVRELLKKAAGMLFEPIMDVVFEVPDTCIGDLVSDISANRRGAILSIGKTQLSSTIHARVPLKEMLGYTSALRTISRGTGSMTMSFYNYEHVGQAHEHELVNNLVY